MNCDGCGKCCEVVMLDAVGGSMDLEWLEAHGGRQLPCGKIILPVRCKFYDAATKKCTNYENRPKSCRMFKVGGVDCFIVRHSV